MKKHLIVVACALVLMVLAVVLPAAAADGMKETGPALEGSAHVNIAEIHPAINIVTMTNGQDADTPPGPSVPAGSTVSWSYVVTNTGNVALTNVQITDNRGVAVSAPKTSLAPSESMTATASGTAQAGQYANIGTVTGSPPSGPVVMGSNPSHYFGVAPSIDIQMRTNGVSAGLPPGPSVPVGSTVQWTYMVTNTGNVWLTNVLVADDQGVAVTAPKTVLAPGESMAATASGTAQAGQYANVGTVTGTPPTGPALSASAVSHYYGIVPLIADFTSDVWMGGLPLSVQFTDTSTGDGLTNWSWDFGDGETSTERHPLHTYDALGHYDVNLTVTNAAGSDSEVKTDYITVTAPPVTGADRGYFLVSTVPAGAEIYLEGLGGTRYHQGNTSAGPLNVTLCLTCTPMKKIVANLTGYREAAWNITQYPAKGETVPVLLTLEPIATPTPTPAPYRPNAIPGRIEAENYDLGGEGVAYRDTTPGNAGGLYRTDDVDLERFSAEGSPSVGWIRSSEWLTYTAIVAQSGTYTLRARVASPYSGRKAYLSVDGAPKATIEVPYTGSYATFATVQVPVTLTAGTRVLKVYFSGDGQNLNWLDFASGTVTTPTPPPAGTASFTAAPLSAPKGIAVKFTLTPKAGKTVKSVWWSFDATAHLNTWNSRAISPTFFYPAAGTFSPLVRIAYTDNSVEEVRRAGYIRAT